MSNTTIKEEARRLLDKLPEGATWEDLQYQIYFRQSVEVGLADSQADKVVPFEEARRRFDNEPRFRIRCEAVKYRQGFFEVVGCIHPKLVNLETWQVSADVNIAGLDVGSEQLNDRDFVANTEIELTPAQARLLAEVLMTAANTAEAEPTQIQDAVKPE